MRFTKKKSWAPCAGRSWGLEKWRQSIRGGHGRGRRDLVEAGPRAAGGHGENADVSDLGGEHRLGDGWRVRMRGRCPTLTRPSQAPRRVKCATELRTLGGWW